MKYLILVLLLAGCGIELELENPDKIEVEVMEIPEIKIAGGQVFLRAEGHCIAVDHSLETGWVSVVIIDGFRGEYSAAEKSLCEAD